MRKQVYLDYASSTPIDTKVLKAMMPYLRRHYGNPSSMHSFGQKARAAIEQAREQVAQFLHCQALGVVFTSGATEANNLAIQGVIKSEIRSTKFETNSIRQKGGQNSTLSDKPHIVTTAIEHESVLEPCRQLEKEGIAEVTYVKPQQDGRIQPQDVGEAVKENTVLVSVQYANSEIGTTQPIAEIGDWLKSKAPSSKSKILFHTDAVQAANYLECDVEKLGVDLLTLSGHKIYGPKGVGVLYVRNGIGLNPLAKGGGQEMGLRSGTENVAAIVGMGEAIQEIHPVIRQGAPSYDGANPKLAVENIRIRQLRDKLIKAVLQKIPDSELTGSLEHRLANNVHVRFSGVEGRDLVILLDQKGIAVSTGSACSEKTREPSHVLLALGLSREEAFSALRLTLGKHTKQEEIEQAGKALVKAVAQLRRGKV